eukprot:g1190.t1
MQNTASESTRVSRVKSLVSHFKSTYEVDPEVIAAAPGRVNLIGEHTDYQDGFVMPFCLDNHETIVAARLRKSNIPTTRITSTNVKSDAKFVEFTINHALSKGKPSWANYVKGVLYKTLAPLFLQTEDNTEAKEKTGDTHWISLDIAFHSNVPLGGGLSSSASLEVATATMLAALLPKFMARESNQQKAQSMNTAASPFPKLLNPEQNDGQYIKQGDSTSRMKLALLCQKAEHDFCGVPCGIMDQAVSALGMKGHLLLLDCNDQKCTHIPFPIADHNLTLVVCNSNAPHELTGGEYAARVAECKEAVANVNKSIQTGGEQTGNASSPKKSLRFISLKELDKAKESMSATAYKRGYHVITENDRCLKAAEACKNADWTQVGKLMYASHESLKNNFEVSTSELDCLVEIAKNVEGVYGSRMTGGGFGGCTVTLVKAQAKDELCQKLIESYQAKTGKTCTILVTSPGCGSSIVSIT